MLKPRKVSLDMSKNEAENSAIFIKERYELMKWTTNVEIKSPNLLIPLQIANYVESLPFCKVAVSPKCDRVALMSHARLLDIYTVVGEILEESAPEYCLLQFSSTGNLLISSRSTPHLDIFDQMGGYCYDIPMESSRGYFDATSAVSCMQTLPHHAISSNDKFTEILYTLQYTGDFTVYKIGRLSKFEKLWSVPLEIGLTSTFKVLPQYNLLLVAAHHSVYSKVNPPGGLCSFRLLDSEPHVEPIRVIASEGGWLSRLPFSAITKTFFTGLSLSLDSTQLVGITTTGSVYVFEVPSTRLKMVYNYISGPRPVQISYADFDEMVIIFDTGTLIRCSPDELEEKLHTVKKSKKFDPEDTECELYSGHTIMIAPAQREVFLLSSQGDNSVLREAAHKRVTLAGRLWIFTLWTSFKNLVGIAVGDAAQPLQMATHVAHFHFSLVHSPTRSLQELFERTLGEHDYARARDLANAYDSIDLDLVLKSEWCELCRIGAVTLDHIDSILKNCNDSEWVAQQCASTEVEKMDVQKELIDLGLSLDTKEVSVIWRIQLLHNARIMAVCEDVESFLTTRQKSCLDAAVVFAQKAQLESLYRILSTNLPVLAPFQERIISAIPSCIQPSRYENLLPIVQNGAISAWEVEEASSEFTSNLQSLAEEGVDTASLVRLADLGDVKSDDGSLDYIKWVRERVRKIDFECGLTRHILTLLSISISRGFEELKEDVAVWERFADYVNMCTAINESIESFETRDVKTMIDRFLRLTEEERIRNAEKIISIIEWKVEKLDDDPKALRSHIQSLLVQSTERSSSVLTAFREVRPEVVDQDMITECLLNLSATGADLLQSLQRLPSDAYANVRSALGCLLSRDVKMTFKAIFESMNDADGARRVLIKMTRSGHCETLSDWASLRDDVVDMAEGIFKDLITKEEALMLLAQEILENERVGQNPELMSLVLTLRGQNRKSTPSLLEDPERKLDITKSGEVLLAKSAELMSEATHRDDPLLGRSRFFAVTAREIAPKAAAEQLRWLDAVEQAQELGCTMMPIGIKFAVHDQLLTDIVRIGSNYKQGKKCAKLAQLLGVETPVATALSHCALAALKANDATYLSRYIGEVISKARNLPVVHKLCMQIMNSPHVPTDMNDIYACAVLNSTDLNLMETMEAINRSREAKLQEKEVIILALIS
ncbi:unnamed protein product [Caenorhabditis auriculariae]|uniref:Sec39 domain-containing protein n=1 Tax=Caenorhabditis auriculariae TaxID=2777116 RepID=A0A8S1GN42_9PELO|nr:unnamed protein product [Caenorhabditis auriculariae]